MQFTKHLKQTGLQCYSKNFCLKQLYITSKSVITKAQEYDVGLKLKILSVCIATYVFLSDESKLM